MSLGFPVSLARFGNMGRWPTAVPAVVIPPITPIDTAWPDEYSLSKGEWPWLVAIEVNGSLVGHGALVALDWVITSGLIAAYAGDALGLGQPVNCYVGGVLDDFSDAEEVQEPKSTTTYPTYDPPTFTDDIGLLFFSSPYIGSANVSAVGYANGTSDGPYYLNPALLATAAMGKYAAGSFSGYTSATISVLNRLTDFDAEALLPYTFQGGMMGGQDSDDNIYTMYGSPWMANNGNGGDYLVGVMFQPPFIGGEELAYFTEVGKYAEWIAGETGVSPNSGI